MDQGRVREQLLASIGARVRALRLAAGLTVKAFAEQAALSPRFVNQLEAGTGNISVNGLARVAAVLGRSMHDLIPPAADDLSISADVWRRMSDFADDELYELQQWMEARTAKTSRPPFVALIGLRGAGKSTVGPLV